MKFNTVPNSVWRDPWQFIAFGLGSGAMPVAPGTFGTLMAMPFYVMLAQLTWKLYLLIVGCSFIAACVLCEIASRQIGEHDHSGMVIDEVVGYWLTMTAIPFGWKWMLAGFILFRIFDIIKPWPISYCDKNIKGGFGIMFDDALAAGCSWIILKIAAKLFS